MTPHTEKGLLRPGLSQDRGHANTSYKRGRGRPSRWWSPVR